MALWLLLWAFMAIPSSASDFDQGKLENSERIKFTRKNDSFGRFIRAYNALSDVPALRELVMEIRRDPQVPMNLKRIINDAFLEDTVVLDLSGLTRAEFGIIPEFQAAHFRTYWGSERCFYRTFLEKTDSAAPAKTLDDTATEALRREPEHRNTIFIQGRKMDSVRDGLPNFLHELAHGRFERILEKHIGKISGRLPKGLVREGADGVPEISSQLHDFLTERYAYQIECEASYMLTPKYFSDPYLRDICVDRTNYKSAISRFVIEAYRITDPRVLAFQDQPILDIFLAEKPASAKQPNAAAVHANDKRGRDSLIAQPAAAAN